MAQIDVARGGQFKIGERQVNRLGFGAFTGFQLKIIQEAITLVVFVAFAIVFLKERLAWNYLVAFAFLGVAAFFAFAFQVPGPAS